MLARVQGKDIGAADVLPPSTPIPHFFGAPGTDQARRNLLELAMGVERGRAIDAIAAALIPDCPTDPTPADIAAYYPFWRAVFAREHGTIVRDGVERPYPSPADLNAIGPQLPGAQAAAARFIHVWRFYHCVQEKYGGQAFRKLRAEMSLGPLWPQPDPLYLETPEPNFLTPIGSLSQLVSAGRKAGLLSFPSDAYQEAFTKGFSGGRMDECFNDVGAADAYFATPPWQGGLFPPLDKEQTEFRTSSTRSVRFEVSAPGWKACNLGGGILVFEHPSLKITALLVVLPGGMTDAQAVFSRVFQSRFADVFLARAGVVVPPLSKLGRATLSGVAGDQFGSQVDAKNYHLSVEMIFIKLDADHVGAQLVIKPNPPSPRDATALNQLLSTVRIVTPPSP